MDKLNWLIQITADGVLPVVIAEYLLNDLGIFVKRERRMPKKAPLTALTGFRVGYTTVPNTDYRMAPMDRCAILWHKISSVTAGDHVISVRGNAKDIIEIVCTPDKYHVVLQQIATKRQQHPVVIEEDYAAASWICWRDDDDWGDALASLEDMVREEADTERFLEPEVLEETVITGVVQESAPVMPVAPAVTASVSVLTPSARPKFCSKCGELLPPDGNFCENCGAKIVGI